MRNSSMLEMKKRSYLVAFKDAQTILSNPGASQQDVKDALTALKNAKKKLHGKNQKLQDVHKKNNIVC